MNAIDKLERMVWHFEHCSDVDVETVADAEKLYDLCAASEFDVFADQLSQEEIDVALANGDAVALLNDRIRHLEYHTRNNPERGCRHCEEYIT